MTDQPQLEHPAKSSAGIAELNTMTPIEVITQDGRRFKTALTEKLDILLARLKEERRRRKRG